MESQKIGITQLQKLDLTLLEWRRLTLNGTSSQQETGGNNESPIGGKARVSV